MCLSVSFLIISLALTITDMIVVFSLIIIIIIHSLELFTSALADVFFYWSLSDSKSPQVSRTLLSILAVWIINSIASKHFWCEDDFATTINTTTTTITRNDNNTLYKTQCNCTYI